MNKSTGIVIALVALVAVGGGLYISANNDHEAMIASDQMEHDVMANDKMTEGQMMEEKDAMMKPADSAAENMMMKDESTMMEKGDAMMKAGSYEAYAPEKIAHASATSPVVLFFRASWCPTCKAVNADIKANLSKIPSGLTILDVDYDNSASLKQKYGVTYQHTFVQVDTDGNLIKKWSGSPTLAALIAEVK